MLTGYIEAIARRIIADKRQRGVRPDCATEGEIWLVVSADIGECLRSLCNEGTFRGSMDINKRQMLLLPPQETAQDNDTPR